MAVTIPAGQSQRSPPEPLRLFVPKVVDLEPPPPPSPAEILKAYMDVAMDMLAMESQE